MWVSVVSLPSDGCPAFPFEVQDPETGDYVILSNTDDAQSLFNSWKWNPAKEPIDPGKWGEKRFEYARLTGIGSMIIDKGFQDILRRKNYCERFGVAPFEGHFDDQPDWWVLALNVVDMSVSEASNFVRRTK